jgi:hypothetical protein
MHRLKKLSLDNAFVLIDGRLRFPGIQVGRACVSSETPHQSGSVDQRFPIIVVIL